MLAIVGVNLHLVVVAVFITSVHCCSSNNFLSKKSDQSLNYRLPNNSIPINYHLWIKTDIHKANFNFEGRVMIRIRFLARSDTVTLHARDIIIDKVNMYDKNENLRESNLMFECCDEREFLIINLKSPVDVNSEIKLEITYHAAMMTNEMNGFHATYYKNETLQNVWMATTLFVPTNARRAFPCYDEPKYRAPFELAIQHDKSYHALSNMPVAKVLPISESNYVISTFNETPPIPTYVLTFIVSNLEFISAIKDGHVEQRIYGEPIKLRNGTAAFSIKVISDELSEFMSTFPVTLGMSKIDHVQIPQMNGVIEHLGLITYGESFLLIDENFFEEVLAFQKPQIIGAIAHSLTHQYFGGIVVPQWWQYLWLSEGLATFYQYYIPSLLYPEYKFMERFQDEVIEDAFLVDVIEDKAMSDYIETPSEIQEKFHSAVVFDKSAAVIRMFYEALSPSTFTNGLVIFLDEMRYKSASSKDLHRALQRAFDADNPDNNLNISSFMSSWETQSGYPVVSVRSDGKNIILTQKRFTGDESYSNNNEDSLYSIPITFTTKTQSNFNKTIASHWMTSQTLEINEILSTPDEWIILNIQQVGFYRVDYSRELWDLIIKDYKINFKNIHHTNRKVLHDEMFIAWKILKTMTSSDCLAFLSVLEYEKSGVIWESASQYMAPLDAFLQYSFMYEYFQEMMHKILSPHIETIKEPKVKTDEEELSEEIKRWSRITQHPVYLQREFDKLILYMDVGESIRPDFCSGLRIANATIYRYFLNELISFETFIDLELVRGLGCSMDKNLLNELFITILNPLNKISPDLVSNAIYATTESSIVGLDIVMDLLSDKWWELNQLIPNFVEGLVSSIHSLINSPAHYDKFVILTNKLIQSKVLSPESTSAMLESIQAKLNDEEWQHIKKWFGVNDEEQTSSTITTSTFRTDTTPPGDAVTLATSIKIIAICISLCFLMKESFSFSSLGRSSGIWLI